MEKLRNGKPTRVGRSLYVSDIVLLRRFVMKSFLQ